MGLAIENCKGHVHIFDSDEGGSSSEGFYKISPPIPDGNDSKCLIMGAPLAFQEIVQPTTTLDDKNVLYVFGTAWNELSVSGMLLLGEASTKGALLEKLVSWYESNRVSEKMGPIEVSLGPAGVEAYVTGLRLGQANPRNNTQQFTILMVTADVD